MKFLIIRFSSIGDIVLTTPVIRCLKKQVKNAEVHFLTKSRFQSLVESNPYIEKVHTLSHSWELMLHHLTLEEYDYIIDLHKNLRSTQVKSILNKRSSSFNKLNTRKWIYVNFKLNVMPNVHIVDRYLKTVRRFNVMNDQEGLDYFIPQKEQIKPDDIPASHHAGYIGLVIGAAHNTKKLPVHKLQELCKKLDHPVILLGDKNDRQTSKAIASIDPVKIYDACGKFSINESADIVRQAKLIVTHDTGMMHIACALKKQVISLWGNTVPSFGMYPYYGKKFLSENPVLPYDLIQVNKLWCRPCSKLGYKKCPLRHFKCMENIKVDEILKKIKARL